MFDGFQRQTLIFVKPCEQVPTGETKEALNKTLTAIKANLAYISLLYEFGQDDGCGILLNSEEFCNIFIGEIAREVFAGERINLHQKNLLVPREFFILPNLNWNEYALNLAFHSDEKSPLLGIRTFPYRGHYRLWYFSLTQ